MVSVGHEWAVTFLMPQRVGLLLALAKYTSVAARAARQGILAKQRRSDLRKSVIPELAKLDVVLLLSADQAIMQM